MKHSFREPRVSAYCDHVKFIDGKSYPCKASDPDHAGAHVYDDPKEQRR